MKQAYMMDHELEELRQRLSGWMVRTGWNASQLASAIHAARSHDYVPAASIGHFQRGYRGLKVLEARAIADFLAQWPEPGPYADWRAGLAALSLQRKRQENDIIQARLAQREAERAAYERACLAAEKPRLRSRFPAGVIPPRDDIAQGHAA